MPAPTALAWMNATLLKGEDPLTNMHANQTAQEIVAAARAYEVTGEMRWREACEAYWKCAVTDRGCPAACENHFRSLQQRSDEGEQ